MDTKFKHLNGLIDACFHQDMDIWGASLNEVIGSYRADLSDEGAELLKSDIAKYLTQHESDAEINTDFYSRFQWGLVHDAFGNPREFLTNVASLLSPHAEYRRVG